MQRIEHHPGRIVDVATARVEVVERARHRVVVTGLVDESLAGPVHDDAAWPGALQAHAAAPRLAVDGVAGDAHDRHPPGLAHVAQIRAPGPSPSAVRRRCCSAGDCAPHRAAQEGTDEGLVPLEAAGAQDDAPACAHDDLAARQLDSHPDDRSRIRDQLERPGVGHRDDATVQQALEQTGDQGPPATTISPPRSSTSALRRALVSASNPTLLQSAGNVVIFSAHSPTRETS